MTNAEQEKEALSNAVNNQSFMNYAAIYEGFAEKGLTPQDIEPRVNVFTFKAWKALGRSVKKGEHGVKVITWIPCTKKEEDGTESKFRRPHTTTVFHVTQTQAIQ